MARNGIEELKFVFNYLIDQIKFAESKNGFLVGICSGIFVLTFDFMQTIAFSVLPDLMRLYLWIFIGILLFSITNSIISFFPNTGKSSDSCKRNLYFWGDLIDVQYKEYLESIRGIGCDSSDSCSIDECDFIGNLIRQNKHLSMIIKNKHKKFVLSIKVLSSSVPLFLVCIIVMLIVSFFKY